MTSRRVVLAAHGSGDPRYPTVIGAIAAAVRRELLRRDPREIPDVVVGYLDHCAPRLGDVVEPGDVVVPLMLSVGYHSAIDIPEVAGPSCVVTPPLGPDPRLARACAERLLAAGWDRADPRHLVLAAAGSSDPQARHDVAAVAGWLADEVGRQVVPAYLSATHPRVEELASGAGALVTYLIAPGRFADRAATAGSDLSTGVLGDHPLVAEVAADRALGAIRRLHNRARDAVSTDGLLSRNREGCGILIR